MAGNGGESFGFAGLRVLEQEVMGVGFWPLPELGQPVASDRDLRAHRLKLLRASIAAGVYRPDGRAIARAMLAHGQSPDSVRP